jgi:hypothetical protein
MHKKTFSIIKNLGYDEEVVKDLKSEGKDLNPKLLSASLKKIGLPDIAIKQIKILEDLNNAVDVKRPNKSLIEELSKRCRRSFDAFAQKNIAAKIIFKNSNWTIYSEIYNKHIQKLHEIYKMYFDELAISGLDASLVFDGSPVWRLETPSEPDLSDSV